ncbi:hypothetical protein WA026_022055 [Henosepilachna vigintioctopunctata]|uniref:Uncharacterized protein n=1 Tax=Henosepilachna vigintioctopunctata TaxID=420089 RepID=A0AAW1UGK2_9CUCU
MASFAKIDKIEDKTTSNSTSLCTTFKETDNDKKILEILKTEYKRYIRNKIIFECILECVESLESELGDKLDSTINDIIFEQYHSLGSKQLLGIHLNERLWSCHEVEKLKLVLQNKIHERRADLFAEYKNISSTDLGQVLKTFRTVAHTYDVNLPEKYATCIDYKTNLMKEQQLFMQNITSRSNLLEKLLDLRLKKVPLMCSKANRQCKIKIESNYLKSRIVEYKTKIDIFMEFPRAIEAYQELLKDIKQQQEECELSIEHLKEDKQKYENVSGKEYNEILKTYIMFKNSIDKLNKLCAFVR